jgi:glycogen debranching enzyme
VLDREPDGQASMLALMPLLVSDRLPCDVRNRLRDSVGTYLNSVGPANEPPDSPRYAPDGYRRGPVWAPSTLLLENGLRRAGATDLADQVSERLGATYEPSGFAENFDALTGAGLRHLA